MPLFGGLIDLTNPGAALQFFFKHHLIMVYVGGATFEAGF